MPVVFPYKATFTRGELTPLIHGRPDLEYFQHGLAECKNWIPLRMGGVTRRPGTFFIKAVKTEANGAILVPFVFSQTQAYMLEFGDSYFRVYADQAPVLNVGVHVEVATPYPLSVLHQLRFAQTGDTLFVVHPGYPVRKITRSSHTSWAINLAVWKDGPWLDINATDNAVQISSTGTTGTATWTLTDGINGGAGFTAADIGRLFRIKHTNASSERDWWTYKITAVTSTKIVTYLRMVKGITTPTTATDSETWRLDAWNVYEGYPSHIAFFQQRLMFAATPKQPLTIWGTTPYFYDTFTPGTLDSDSVTFTIAGNQVNAILWLQESSVLVIGTGAGTRTLGPGENGIFSSTSWTLSPATDYRVAAVQPVRIGGTVLYSGGFGKSVRELAYEQNSDNYISPEISLLSEHLFTAGLEGMVFAAEPVPVIYCWLTDGALVVLSYDREQGVTGFAPVVIGGLNVEVEHMATIPGALSDEVWAVIKRTINGATHRYVEVFQDPFIHDTLSEDAWFLDSALFYVGPPASTFSGLGHLEGELVAMWSQGSYLGELTVASGEITLPDARTSTNLVVGLRYSSRLMTMPFHADISGEGDIVGDKMMVNQAFIDLYRSLNVNVGTFNEMYNARGRHPEENMGEGPSLRSGIAQVDISDNWDNGGVIIVEVELPTPALIRSIKLGVEV